MSQQEIAKLSKGWVDTTVGDISIKVTDGSHNPPKDKLEGYPMLSAKNIQNGKIHFELGGRYINNDEFALENKRTRITKGDLLLTIVGALGRAAVVETNERFTLQRSVAVLNAPLIPPIFYKYVLESPRFQSQIIQHAKGTAQKGIYLNKLRSLNLSLPPLNEQKRIVEKLDTLLTQVDTIQQRLNNLPNIIKRFRQSVLAAAVSGRLTQQWRSKNPQINAEKILVELTKTREAKFEKEIEEGNKETKRLLSKVKKHNPVLPKVDLPNLWVWTSFMSSMEKVVDCHNKTALYIDEGIPLIRTTDIRDGRITLKGAKYISQETYDYWSRRCPPSSGDIIFTREAPMGEAGIVAENTVICMGQRMMLLRPMKEFIEPKYILLNILSLNFQERMNKDAIGTGVKHLRVADVEALSYPLAPLAEQTEIVRLVEQHFALADTLEKNLANAKQRVDNLTQSILAKAFKGELVPQDPNDEPADKLLERIKAAREEAEVLEKAAKKVGKKSAKTN